MSRDQSGCASGGEGGEGGEGSEEMMKEGAGGRRSRDSRVGDWRVVQDKGQQNKRLTILGSRQVAREYTLYYIQYRTASLCLSCIHVYANSW